MKNQNTFCYIVLGENDDYEGDTYPVNTAKEINKAKKAMREHGIKESRICAMPYKPKDENYTNSVITSGKIFS